MAYTKQTARVRSLNLSTFFDASDAVQSVDCQAFLESRLTNDADANDVVMRGIPPVRFNLLDPAVGGLNITAAGKTVTYQQLAALMRQACLDRANAQGVQ